MRQIADVSTWLTMTTCVVDEVSALSNSNDYIPASLGSPHRSLIDRLYRYATRDADRRPFQSVERRRPVETPLRTYL